AQEQERSALVRPRVPAPRPAPRGTVRKRGVVHLRFRTRGRRGLILGLAVVFVAAPAASANTSVGFSSSDSTLTVGAVPCNQPCANDHLVITLIPAGNPDNTESLVDQQHFGDPPINTSTTACTHDF